MTWVSTHPLTRPCLVEQWKEIQEAFWDYPSYKIEKLMETKRTVIKEILKCQGNNTYKIPHKHNVHAGGDGDY